MRASVSELVTAKRSSTQVPEAADSRFAMAVATMNRAAYVVALQRIGSVYRQQGIFP
ncbi:MAG: hypothetical protein GY778_10630 [bacterium]|nr:hypothetical protein [bacterium]